MADENTAALPLKTHFSGNRCSAAGSDFLKNMALRSAHGKGDLLRRFLKICGMPRSIETIYDSSSKWAYSYYNGISHKISDCFAIVVGYPSTC